MVTGVGTIQGKDCMIFANENRYAAGTYFPITLKKHMRAQAIASASSCPASTSPTPAESTCPCSWAALPMTATSEACSTTCAACPPTASASTRSPRRQHGGRRLHRLPGLRVHHDRENVLRLPGGPPHGEIGHRRDRIRRRISAAPTSTPSTPADATTS